MSSVSIVITTLNRVEYLAEAIRSALRQTFADFEILVCDDGGLEATKELCETFHDSRLRHIVNPSPLGIAMNTYAGVMAAKSALIAFLNDDDRWTPEFLEKCTRPLIQDKQAVLAFSDHWMIDTHGKRLPESTDQSTRTYCRDTLPAGYVKEPARLIARNSIPLAMASVFRKSAVDWSFYSPNIEGAYDYFISFCLLRSGGAVIYIPERLTEYRIHGGSASAKFGLTNNLGVAYVHGLILRDNRFASIADVMRSKCIGMEIRLVRVYARQMKLVSAIKHIAKAMQYRATSVNL